MHTVQSITECNGFKYHEMISLSTKTIVSHYPCSLLMIKCDRYTANVYRINDNPYSCVGIFTQ